MHLFHDWNLNQNWNEILILWENWDWVLGYWGIPILPRIGMGMGLPPTKQLERESLIPIPIPNPILEPNLPQPNMPLDYCF